MDLLLASIALISAVVGAALAWLLARSRHAAELAATQERARLLEQAHDALRSDMAGAARTHQQLQEQLSTLGRELATTSTRLEEERKQADEKLSLLREMSENSRKSLTEEFQNLAANILEDKTKRFTEQNLEGLGQLLNPFRERLNEFKTRVEEMHYQDAQQQAALKTELAQLKS